MPDVATITGILASLKTATEIAKLLRESDVSLEKAELRLKLAELIGALAEVKIELAGVQETLESKNERIAELESAFEAKDSVIRHRDAYYRVDPDGKPVGVALCLACWERDHKLRQLVQDGREPRLRVCTACGHHYNGMSAGNISPQPPAQ